MADCGEVDGGGEDGFVARVPADRGGDWFPGIAAVRPHENRQARGGGNEVQGGIGDPPLVVRETDHQQIGGARRGQGLGGCRATLLQRDQRTVEFACASPCPSSAQLTELRLISSHQYPALKYIVPAR